MKALKYTLALILGLGMLGFSAHVQAQASGQTAEVVPANATPLPEVSVSAPVANEEIPMQVRIRQDEEQPQPQRGIPTPKVIEDMMNRGDFVKAVSEFEKYMKTAKGNPCDLMFLPYTFYNRLLWEDTTKTAFYQEKVDFYQNKFLQTCGNTVDAYVLKESVMEPKNYDSTLVWMTAAIKVEPDYDILYTIRGHALWELGRTKEACADFKKAKELNEFYGDYYDENCVESAAE